MEATGAHASLIQHLFTSGELAEGGATTKLIADITEYLSEGAVTAGKAYRLFDINWYWLRTAVRDGHLKPISEKVVPQGTEKTYKVSDIQKAIVGSRRILSVEDLTSEYGYSLEFLNSYLSDVMPRAVVAGVMLYRRKDLPF